MLHPLQTKDVSIETSKKQNKELRISVLWPILSCFLVLLLMRDYYGINTPSALFLALSMIVAVFANKSEVISFCFCCIPMLNAFQSKYALFICMVLYIVRFSRKPKITIRIWPIFVLLVWEMMHAFVSPFSLVELMRLFAELLFCCFLMCCNVEEWDFQKIIRSMALTTVFVCTIILLTQLKFYNYSLRNINILYSGVFRFGYSIDETRMSVGFNPNYLAYICLACIEGLSMIVYRKKQTIWDIGLIVLLSIFGLFTMSKKFVLCAAIFIFLLIFASDNVKGKLRLLLVSTIMVIVVGVVLHHNFPTVFESLIGRFRERDITTGRDSIFLFYMNVLLSDIRLFLFGVGLQDYEAKLLTAYPGASIPHNGFQELLVMWGVPGLILFIIFLCNMLFRAKKINRNMCFINYIPFIVMLANVQVTQMVSSSVTNMVMSLVYLYMTFNCKNSF